MTKSMAGYGSRIRRVVAGSWPLAVPWPLLVGIGLLFGAGLGLRLIALTQPPLDFHETRQLHSAVLAHWFYLDSLPSASALDLQVARVNAEREGLLEPPVAELLASVAYRLVGAEELWLPRLLSISFWLIGGIFLYRLARALASEAGALAALAVYLLLPFGVQASRSFQPDPLMVMLMLAGLWAIFRYDEEPTRRRLAIAIVLTGAGLFVKPAALFVLFAAFAVLALRRLGLRGMLGRPDAATFVALTLFPLLTYAAYGALIGHFLEGEQGRRPLDHWLASSVMPQLLETSFFWRGWARLVRDVIGPLPILAALGGLLASGGKARAFLLATWAGYATFCLTFTYHAATHSYYHLQLIPIVALSAAPLATEAFDRPWLLRSAMAIVLIIWSSVSAFGAAQRLVYPDADQQIAVARSVGEDVQHSTRTILIARSSGMVLKYYGNLSGVPWDIGSLMELRRLQGRTPPSGRETLEDLRRTADAEYLVVTRFDQLSLVPDLWPYLVRNFPIVGRTSDYAVFDLRRSLAIPDPADR